jgi:hypothetical protein
LNSIRNKFTIPLLQFVLLSRFAYESAENFGTEKFWNNPWVDFLWHPKVMYERISNHDTFESVP